MTTARRGAMLLAALSIATAPALAAIDDEPGGIVQSSTTLARVRALYDRAHPREHGRNVTVLEDWRLFQDGTVGSYRVNRLGRDVRETTTLGPLAYELFAQDAIDDVGQHGTAPLVIRLTDRPVVGRDPEDGGRACLVRAP